jgi:predicted amidohydrolase YtcJ
MESIMNRLLRVSLTTLAAALALVTTAAAAPTVIEHVKGYTLAGNHLQRFDALVFENGKVLATGRAATLRKSYADAKVIDGHGKTLLPGLIDAHGHVLDLGLASVRIRLEGTADLKDALDKVRAYATQHTDRAWIQGGGWNQVTWQLGRFPLASELDTAVGDRPAILGRVDGHAVWLNTRALSAAGITRETADPPGGRIERDTAGNPSGVLVDGAMALVDRVVPAPTAAEQRSALKVALAHNNSVGLTAVDDAGVSAQIISLYHDLADHGELTSRVYAMIAGTGDDFHTLATAGPLIGYGNDFLTVRSVKLLADGALGSRGAAMMADYTDQPGQRGLLFNSDAIMQSKLETALKAGYQVNVHAIGDAANHQVLDAFEAAYKKVGGRELRNRIEHAQVVPLADIPRFRTLDLIASMQPTHATSDMNMAEDRIGKERLKGAYAWRTFLHQGTRIAGGSDFPVESDNPFFGLHAAVTRSDHTGKPPGGWHAEQRMTLLEAFRAFTADAAYARHAEKSLGTLEPGKWADFILVDRDLFAIAPADIWKVGVEQTWVAGKQVFAREPAAGH